MKKYLKQYMGLDISLSRDIFLKTRLKFTILFMIIMMSIVIFFSVSIFEIVSKDIKMRPLLRPNIHVGEKRLNFESIKQVPDHPLKETYREIKDEVLENIKNSLILIDIILFILVSYIGFILSGFVLKPIKDTYERQKRFIQDISHDLKTPISIMHSELEVEILKGSDNKVYKSLLEEVKHLNSLVQDVFLLSKLDLDKESNKEVLDISNICEDQLQKFEVLFKEKGIKLIKSNFRSYFIYGNTNLIERAISNILSNSLKYTKEGSVSISLYTKDSFVFLDISDTGIGIEKEKQKYIFNRFYKVDESRKNLNSSGLGLSIVSEIVKNHNGNIKIYSEINKGTKVSMSLPIVEKK
jgi:two-component system sensor histidine kinase CiaH